MSFKVINLQIAADIIEESKILNQASYPGACVKLDLQHPSMGTIVLLQSGSTVFVATTTAA